jgi:hypothetical protein
VSQWWDESKNGSNSDEPGPMVVLASSPSGLGTVSRTSWPPGATTFLVRGRDTVGHVDPVGVLCTVVMDLVSRAGSVFLCCVFFRQAVCVHVDLHGKLRP